MKDETRANEFDRIVGGIQTLYSIKMGVGKSLLDIGCGWGEFTHLFLNKFERVVGLDPSEEYLEVARKANPDIEYICEYGESFKLPEGFDTIVMNNLLEHIEYPLTVLSNCKLHLNRGGRLIVQVPNANSITRRLGVLMGIIPSIDHISEKERDFYGHHRTYTIQTLKEDCKKAGLKVVKTGGILYKPLPNEELLKICHKNGPKWSEKFIDALVSLGEQNSEDSAQIYAVCE